MGREGSFKSPGKQRWVQLAKALFSLTLLILVLWKVPVEEAWEGIRSLSLAALLAVVGLTFVFPLVATIRWKRVLAHLDVQHQFRPLMGDALVSSTYNMLLPTNIGGDVVRALRCSRRINRGHQAWSSVLFERLVGIVALALLAVPGLVMVPGHLQGLGWAVGATVLLSVLILLFAPAPFRYACKLLAARAPVVAEISQGIAADLAEPLAKTMPRLETMLWSLLYQAVGLGILVVVVFDWGEPSMTWAILGGVPLALILTLLPVSIAGLGVRESLFVVLLGLLGVDSGRALSLALVWLASALLLAVAGAVILLLEASRPPCPKAKHRV